MDLRLSFNGDAAGYDRFRPTYADELFADVIRFSGLDENKRALEIGIGTGQATLPFLRTGCSVVAVEIGDKLARFSREKFAEFRNLEVINRDFESVRLDQGSFDLVYSASAFHWIPRETGLPKVHGLLKSGGAFAWFSNRPVPAQEDACMREALQEVYGRYGRFFAASAPAAADPRTRQRQAEAKRSERAETLRQYGFVDVTGKFYYGTRTFGAEDYVALLGTYSDHKAMPEENRLPFLKEIAAAVDRCGGKLMVSDNMLLCLGRKP